MEKTITFKEFQERFGNVEIVRVLESWGEIEKAPDEIIPGDLVEMPGVGRFEIVIEERGAK